MCDRAPHGHTWLAPKFFCHCRFSLVSVNLKVPLQLALPKRPLKEKGCVINLPFYFLSLKENSRKLEFFAISYLSFWKARKVTPTIVINHYPGHKCLGTSVDYKQEYDGPTLTSWFHFIFWQTTLFPPITIHTVQWLAILLAWLLPFSYDYRIVWILCWFWPIVVFGKLHNSPCT